MKHIITSIKEIGRHDYSGQNESAVCAKVTGRKGYCWYVGFGGDLSPAKSVDLQNIQSIRKASQNDNISWHGTEVD